LVDDLFENLAALLEAFKLVEAGARRRQQNGIARLATRVRVRDGRIQRFRIHSGAAPRNWLEILPAAAPMSRAARALASSGARSGE